MSTAAFLGRVLALSVVLLTPMGVAAQDIAPPRDTLGPRGGEWGAELGVGPGLSATLLRFRSQATAWLIGGQGQFVETRVEQSTGPGGGALVQTQTNASVLTRFGLRRYQVSSRPLRAFTGAGLTAGFGRAGAGTTWSGGVFAELGGSYFFSPHLSLGASGGLQALYARTTAEQVEFGGPTFSYRSRTLSVNATAVQLLAAVYF